MILPGRTFIARHGETVFNAAGRLQGGHSHTPLTRAGLAQVEAMGDGLRALLGIRPSLQLYSSPAGRALQTLAIIAEHLELDWHAAHIDDRLVEIGMGAWGGRYLADLTSEVGPMFDPETGLLRVAPDGEMYHEIGGRVTDWAFDAAKIAGDRLVIMHGISSRVLRGVLTGLEADPVLGVPIASSLPQGTMVKIENAREEVVVQGQGRGAGAA